MAEFHQRLRLDISPEVAWAVVGNLAGVDTWIPGVTGVKIEGNVRICTFANGVVQQEEISYYSKERRSYHYSINGGPLPLKSNRGRWAVEADGTGSVVLWDAEIEVSDQEQEEQVTQMLGDAYKHVLQLLHERIVEAQRERRGAGRREVL
jgi:carbon monoxide dehydrogenase subunit G